jgi:hypothetical protein
MFGKNRAGWSVAALVIACLGGVAAAVPTNEDILRSFNENMDQVPDYSRLIPWLFAAAGIVVVLVYLQQRQKRQAVPRVLNHPGKLVREIIRGGGIDPLEMKRLAGLARELDCENPLTLLLCPSLLDKKPAEAPVTEEPDRNSP